jgi:hypothetical protein
VQPDEGVDELLAGTRSNLRRKPGNRVGTVEHDAVDERHHVERGTQHVLIGAQCDGLGHGHVGRHERGDHAELACHVVRGG